MPDAGRGGPSRARRRGLVATAIVVILALGGGGAAWAVTSNGPNGYRMARVVTASVNNDLNLVGTIEPVSNASVAFQTAGKVSNVSATVGEHVTAGQSLATLETAALNETVSSDQSALSADEAKLVEDENAQSSAATSHAQTTTTTAPSHANSGASNPTGSTASTATITQDQNALATDEATTDADRQQEAADLAQAETACGTFTPTTTTTSTTTTTTPADPQACTNALGQVSNDEQKVSADQARVGQDEAALAAALGESTGSSPTGSTGGNGPTGTATGAGTGTGTGTGGKDLAHNLAAAAAAAPSGNSNPAQASSNLGSSGSGASGTPTDTPQQIAQDQAAIDSAKANLIGAQQAMNAATLTSPINGTVVSIGITTGQTVSSGSGTAVIEVVGTTAYEVVGNLDSAQVASVKVGQHASVSPDSQSAPMTGTVSQVGPVESTSSGYTYPVVVSLPSSVQGLYSGSTANETIATGQVVNVVAVPTSAVITQGARSYVLVLKDGALTEHRVKTGMVGGVYTQILSGLHLGQSVVLADLSESVPSSNDASLGGGAFGGFGGIGGPGGVRGFISRAGGNATVTINGGPGGKG